MLEKSCAVQIQLFKLPLLALVVAGFIAGTLPSASAKSEEDAPIVADEGPIYLKMKPLGAPIWKKGRIKYSIFLTLSLEFDDADKKDIVNGRIPKLRDAFLLELHNKSILHRDETRGINFPRLKKRLMASAVKAVGKDTIKDILVLDAQSVR